MGDVARRGYWRRLLNHYMRLPDSVRAFDRTDNPDRRVIDKTVFAPRPSSLCPEPRRDLRRGPCRSRSRTGRPVSQQAEAGKRYQFPVKGGFEFVHLPDRLPAAGPVRALGTVAERVRQPWHVSFEKDLSRAAKEIDKRWRKSARYPEPRLGAAPGEAALSLADPDPGTCAPGPGSSRSTALSTLSA